MPTNPLQWLQDQWPSVERQRQMLQPLPGWQGTAVGAAHQYANALLMGTTAPRSSGLIDQLVSHFGAADRVPPSEMGGQQINMVLPDGRISSAELPDHQMMLKAAGIPGTLEDFMASTGAIRSHGPDNYDVRSPPTGSQIRAMSRYARDNGHTDVWVDADPGGGKDVVSDSVPISRLSSFFNDAFGQ